MKLSPKGTAQWRLRKHRLYQVLEAKLGAEHATTLMEHLPPAGWADVAMKRDVDGLGCELRLEMAVVKHELRVDIADVRTDMAKLSEQLTNRMRSQAISFCTANVALTGAVIAAAKLL